MLFLNYGEELKRVNFFYNLETKNETKSYKYDTF